MSTGKIELSVGAIKIADKYEIFTEEEIDNINKIPDIEDELEESVKFEIVGEGTTVPPISGGGSSGGYALPIATKTRLGGVKIGNNLSIDSSGVLSATTSDYDDTEIRELIDETNMSLDNIKRIGINILSFDGKDDTEKFQNALNSDYYVLEVPNITITRPLTVPWNRGKIIRGIGGLKRGVINVQFGEEYSDRSAIEYITNENGEHNWAGITIENIHLIGNNSKTNGIKLQYVCYPLFG